MTRVTTAAFDAANALLAKEAVKFVRFTWVHPTTFVEYPFSVDFADKAVQNPTKTKRLYVQRITGNVQTITPEQGRSTSGQFSVELNDRKEDGARGEVTKYLSDPAVALLGAITAISPANGGNLQAASSVEGYPVLGTIELRDATGAVVERMRYTGLDLVNDRFTNITRGVDGTTASAHADQTAIHNGEQIRPQIRCQFFLGYASIAEADYMAFQKFEVIERRDAVSGISYEIIIADTMRFLERKIFIEATPQAPITLTGNPLTIALQVLLTTAAGGNHATYDLGVGDRVGMPAFLVDVAGFEAVRDTDLTNPASPIFTFEIKGSVRAKDWLEQEIFKPNNCYPIITQDGKYSTRRYVPAPAPGSQPILDDTIFAGGRPRWEGGDALVINEVFLFMDWDFEINPGKFNTVFQFQQSESIGLLRKRAPLIIQSQGMRSDANGVEIARNRALQVFKRFAFPPPAQRVPLFFLKMPLEAADIVKLTDPVVFNPRTGLRGMTNEIMEITDIRPVFDQGFVEVRLLHTGAIPDVTAQDESGAVGNLLSSVNTIVLPAGAELFKDPQDTADLNGWTKNGIEVAGAALIIASGQGWDDGGTWDDGSFWDKPVPTDPTNALSPVFALGARIEGHVAIGAVASGTALITFVEAQYSIDGTTFGITPPNFTDGNFERLRRVTLQNAWFGSRVSITHFKVRVNLQTGDPNEPGLMRSIVVRFIAPFVEDAYFNETIPAGGRVFTWRVPFGEVPHVTVTPIGTLLYTIPILTTVQGEIHLNTLAGVDVGGQANVIGRSFQSGT